MEGGDAASEVRMVASNSSSIRMKFSQACCSCCSQSAMSWVHLTLCSSSVASFFLLLRVADKLDGWLQPLRLQVLPRESDALRDTAAGPALVP
eukprot:300797-Amphidinium_carterae.1